MAIKLNYVKGTKKEIKKLAKDLAPALRSLADK